MNDKYRKLNIIHKNPDNRIACRFQYASVAAGLCCKKTHECKKAFSVQRTWSLSKLFHSQPGEINTTHRPNVKSSVLAGKSFQGGTEK